MLQTFLKCPCYIVFLLFSPPPPLPTPTQKTKTKKEEEEEDIGKRL